ncbi:MAG TPA: acyl-CoA dehydrogenase family protein [Actinomycetota bacterium]|nr:acyl-CoA dehydrogenase family protein [Actinomycetota bacterium]
MQFAPETEEQAALRKLARDVADRELVPRAAHWDETEEFPHDSWKAIAGAGLFGVTVGEDYGGAGLTDLEGTIVLEELARADVSSAILCQLIFNGAPRAIEHLGNETLKGRWLPAAASGESLFCLGITEPDAGSAVQHMRTQLVTDGDGYRLTGYKNYVTAGHVASACLVWTRFPGSSGANGIGSVIVELDRAGVSVASIHKKMGLRGNAEAELAFDGVRIDPDDVLVRGEPENSSAFRTLLSHLNHERCGNGAMCIGAAQGALEYAIRYMNERTLGETPIAQLQGLQWKIADMSIRVEEARLLLYRAVSMAGPGGTPPALESAMAKAACNLAARYVCDEAIQILGGYGYSREYPVERMYRDVRGLLIGAGTVEVQRNYIASKVLKGDVPASAAWRKQLR